MCGTRNRRCWCCGTTWEAWLVLWAGADFLSATAVGSILINEITAAETGGQTISQWVKDWAESLRARLNTASTGLATFVGAPGTALKNVLARMKAAAHAPDYCFLP